ncbi:MAG: sensor histidine kinase [Lachnospiraceae bacterium]|nr:sensor histidine kinase [Lachnospiraceae bacterium]
MIFVIIPMVALSSWLFRVMEDDTIAERESALLYRLGEGHDEAVKNADSINMSTQFFLSDQGLQNFLAAQKRGEEYTTEELLEFYSRDVASLERMVNNNASLYQIRVYVDSDVMQEMMPILYRKERMDKLSWAADEELYGWKYGYEDRIFDTFGQLYGNREILALITPMETYNEGEIGILEVAMYMDTMFPMVYDSPANQWACFADGSGRFYFSEEKDTAENRQLAEKILQLCQPDEEASVCTIRKNGSRLVVGCQLLRGLDGVLICAEDISEDVAHIHGRRLMFVIIGVAVMALFVCIVNWAVKAVLGKFYKILSSIREVQKGNLDVVIEDCGRDEMGELGSQINAMLVSIKQLTDDNLKHELLVKNTEIRALQNQINAHFIYNVLESIKMMAEIEEKYEISDATTALGRLLRYSMRWTSGNVTVAEELEYIRNYLRLINLRFDYEIYLSENIPEEIMKQEIPKMSLQPIVENAIYHGIEQIAEDTNIYIKGIIEEDDCIIEITDAGRGMSEEEVANLYRKINGELEASGGSGNGIGLKNVQDRIKMNFGEKYGIEIASKLGCYTKIRVRIPMSVREG